MALNPDNFIFHSDFWYPTNYQSGVVSVNNQTTPRTVALTAGYEPGDYYTVFKEQKYPSDHPVYPNADTIYTMGFGEAFYPMTIGGNLSAYQGSVGNITAKMHWRLYKKPKAFNFISKGRMEKVYKTYSGTVPGPFGSVWEHLIDIGHKGRYYIRGMFRRAGQGWTSFNDRSTNGQGDFAFASLLTPVGQNSKINMSFHSASVFTAVDWEYIIQLIPLEEDSNFIFSSTEYPFSLPENVARTITPPTTIAANATVRRTGPSYTLPGEKLSYNVIFRAAHGFAGVAESSLGYLEYPAAPLSGGNYTVYARAGVTVSGRTITPYIDYVNTTGSSMSVNQVNATAYIYAYQNNNSA